MDGLSLRLLKANVTRSLGESFEQREARLSNTTTSTRVGSQRIRHTSSPTNIKHTGGYLIVVIKNAHTLTLPVPLFNMVWDFTVFNKTFKVNNNLIKIKTLLQITTKARSKLGSQISQKI